MALIVLSIRRKASRNRIPTATASAAFHRRSRTAHPARFLAVGRARKATLFTHRRRHALTFLLRPPHMLGRRTGSVRLMMTDAQNGIERNRMILQAPPTRRTRAKGRIDHDRARPMRGQPPLPAASTPLPLASIGERMTTIG